MNVFIFEYLCSGSAAPGELSPEMVPMGSAMLQATAADFLAAGVTVTTMLDHRISLPLGHAQVTRIDRPEQARSVFEKLSQQADATLVIAPESDGLLQDWVANLEARQCPTLNSHLKATMLCTDKLLLAQTLHNAGVSTPSTRLLRSGPPVRFPAVIKPRRGAGSEWTFICHDASDMQSIPQWEDWITQPLAQGTAASCGVLVLDGQITALPAGMQIIEGDRRFHYRGGQLPLHSATAGKLAKQAVAAVDGLKGYVGVDMILGNSAAGEPDMVIEINPRITMSYLGLRALCEQNLAEAMIGRVPATSLTWHTGSLRFDTQGQIVWETTT